MTLTVPDSDLAADLIDLARNVAGVDHHWLYGISHRQLLQLVEEWRRDAGAILDKKRRAERHPNREE